MLSRDWFCELTGDNKTTKHKKTMSCQRSSAPHREKHVQTTN